MPISKVCEGCHRKHLAKVWLQSFQTIEQRFEIYTPMGSYVMGNFKVTLKVQNSQFGKTAKCSGGRMNIDLSPKFCTDWAAGLPVIQF